MRIPLASSLRAPAARPTTESSLPEASGAERFRPLMLMRFKVARPQIIQSASTAVMASQALRWTLIP